MNKKGFTLVELLAVLIILGVLAIITTTVILNQVNESKDKLTSQQIKIVQSAAIDYCNDKGLSKQNGIKHKVYLSTLVNEALINKNLINSLDDGNYYIEITAECTEVCYFKASSLLKD